jgi:predicted pyridoxine 5'-phosphate oxidase superfamily flavin-nucleotide-binding protein
VWAKTLLRNFLENEMAKNFAEIAFTESVKSQQEKYGSRRQYARLKQTIRGIELTDHEIDFIAERDGFYLATVGEQGQPYVQFRGGPKGFLKVIDSKTLGYADFRGNLQYISVGNLQKNNRAALILMDYANRARLKIFATVEMLDAAENPELIAKLEIAGYQAKVERAAILHLEAFDWNCPQHITQRFTIEEIQHINAPLYAHIEKLEKEIAR